MSGAYSAKPSRTEASLPPGWVTLPPGWMQEGAIYIVPEEWEDYPSDWDSDWPFPSTAFPPGYEPLYSISLTADSEIMVSGGTNSVVANLNDREYITTEPFGSVTFSATKDGELLKLRKDGDIGFSDSVEYSYTQDGITLFFESKPTLYFNLSESDVGKTIVLTATSTPFGSEISGTANISVIEDSTDIVRIVLNCKITNYSFTDPLFSSFDLSGEIQGSSGNTGGGYIGVGGSNVTINTECPTSYSDENFSGVLTSDTEFTLALDSVIDTSYSVVLYMELVSVFPAEFSVTASFYDEGNNLVLEETYSTGFDISPVESYNFEFDFLTFNFSTQEITIQKNMIAL